ncbi:MAG: cytidine deaminase [Micromonosporaceae bacterium]|nr:cytidine deaminase [Micromonosporaceae bacterium]
MEQRDIDWAALRLAATEVMRRAYTPYSNFPVGAAGLVDDGRVVVGCNVENAAYGVVLCAECGVVSALHASGGGRLVALACVDAAGAPLMPCGRCRQLLWENGGPSCLVDAVDGPLSMSEVLPHAFGSDDLDRVREQALPARLQQWQGRGSVVVHSDSVGGQRVWTAYWDRSTGSADDEERGILEEAPTWADRADAIAWGRARTPRVFLVDEDGTLRDPDDPDVGTSS